MSLGTLHGGVGLILETQIRVTHICLVLFLQSFPPTEELWVQALGVPEDRGPRWRNWGPRRGPAKRAPHSMWKLPVLEPLARTLRQVTAFVVAE